MNLIYFRHVHNDYAPNITKDETYFYELTLVLSGYLEYTVNGKRIKINQGDALFITPNTLRARKQADHKVNYISFNFLCPEKTYDFPTVIKDAVSRECKLMISCADEIFNKYYLDVFYQIEPLLEGILRNVQSRLKQIEENPLVVKIKNHVNAFYAKKINLNDLSKELFFSKSYIELIFKKFTGFSIIQYLNKVRIEKAKLLLNEQPSLKTVAEATGFTDVNYFVRVFKKNTGQTPMQYVKSLRENNAI